MVVLEELDRGKKGMSEVARNVRQVSRFLDDLIVRRPKRRLTQGSRCRAPSNGAATATTSPTMGSYSSRPSHLPAQLPDSLPGNTPDNTILATALALQEMAPERVGDSGVQGHQSAHQGRGGRHPCRGLSQRPGAR